MKYALTLLTLAGTPAVAQTLDLACTGTAPDWSLTLNGETVEFDYRRTSDLTLMLDTPAVGEAAPRALTLIGRGDSAILILEKTDACRFGTDAGGYDAMVLTQRGETPVLLTGCCLS
ncbi:hypothetical protein [Pseudooctadecabacter jejudonensis]|uniref:Lysozyme inhibitor n=1 Tax=Pseudooctadecabacter jejudonensis TaxID=1391910 RepID=A0A1Y5REJ0_9RHOB|nr:hypothetical protein [Pseudooctadecabacter jejudonensis]SLN15616.1 hypothetical protein PSJ8397_00350 [Pseudooctadecabacter jejudonensis]